MWGLPQCSSLLDVNSLSQHCLVAFTVHMPLYSCLGFYVLNIFYGCPCRKFDFIHAISLLRVSRWLRW